MEQLCLPPPEVSRHSRDGAPVALLIPAASPQIRRSDREESSTVRNSREGAPVALPIPAAPLNSVAASSSPTEAPARLQGCPVAGIVEVSARRAPLPLLPTPTRVHKIDMPPATPEGHR